MGLRKILDDLEHHFQEGGRFQKWFALYEVFDTFLKPASTDEFFSDRSFGF